MSVFIIITRKNGKQGKARNLAIKIKRKYLAFLDADDLWIPQKSRNTTNEIRRKECRLVFGFLF
jgi:glycosyltransferase involved in cell wall biosynthesis